MFAGLICSRSRFSRPSPSGRIVRGTQLAGHWVPTAAPDRWARTGLAHYGPRSRDQRDGAGCLRASGPTTGMMETPVLVSESRARHHRCNDGGMVLCEKTAKSQPTASGRQVRRWKRLAAPARAVLLSAPSTSKTASASSSVRLCARVGAGHIILRDEIDALAPARHSRSLAPRHHERERSAKGR